MSGSKHASESVQNIWDILHANPQVHAAHNELASMLDEQNGNEADWFGFPVAGEKRPARRKEARLANTTKEEGQNSQRLGKTKGETGSKKLTVSEALIEIHNKNRRQGTAVEHTDAATKVLRAEAAKRRVHSLMIADLYRPSNLRLFMRPTPVHDFTYCVPSVNDIPTEGNNEDGRIN